MKIQIVFTKPRTFLPIFSYAIRAYQRSEYSHVAIILTDKRGREFVYEAVGSGIRFVAKKVWLEKVSIVSMFTLKVSPYEYRVLMDYCIENAGLEYGFMQNIGVVIANIFNMKSNPFKKGKNCSEVLAEILIRLGYKISKPLDLVTPKDIFILLEESKNKS